MNIISHGGLMIYPLIILSILSLGIIFDKFITFSTNKLNFTNFNNSSELYKDFLEILQSPLPPSIKEEKLAVEGETILFRLGRKLDLLATISMVAPLMGLLGTVIGMINAFAKLSASGNADINLLAGGIWQALITTAVGLSIAIPSTLAHRYFCRQYDKVTFKLQQIAATQIQNDQI